MSRGAEQANCRLDISVVASRDEDAALETL